MAMVRCSDVTFAQTERPSPYKLTIVAAGIYETDRGIREPAANSVSGFIRRHDSYRLVEATDTVCARLGRNFGVEYQIVGTPSGVTIPVVHATLFPSPGIVRPDGTTVARSRFDDTVTVGGIAHRSFTFDEPWEMVDGEWTFEFHIDGKRVGDKRFMVMTRCETS